jgi:hypothetical protein
MRKLILTLVLGVAAAASAQTTGDPRCADSTVGKYWVAVTQDGGYCAATAQSNTPVEVHQCPVGHTWVNTNWGGACVTNETAPRVATQLQHQALSQTMLNTPAFADCRLEHVPSVFLFDSPVGGKVLSEIPCAGEFTVLQSSDNWDKVQTSDGRVGWIRPTFVSFTALPATGKPIPPTGDWQCANSTVGKYWVATTYGGYCGSSKAEAQAKALAQPGPQMPASAQQVDLLAVQQQHDQQQQQAKYQRQLLQQQADYQQQLLQQQDKLARRQMVFQYLMNRPSYTPAPPVYNPSVVAPFYNNLNNNNIHCTTQTLGNTSYTNCY